MPHHPVGVHGLHDSNSTVPESLRCSITSHTAAAHAVYGALQGSARPTACSRSSTTPRQTLRRWPRKACLQSSRRCRSLGTQTAAPSFARRCCLAQRRATAESFQCSWRCGCGAGRRLTLPACICLVPLVLVCMLAVCIVLLAMSAAPHHLQSSLLSRISAHMWCLHKLHT